MPDKFSIQEVKKAMIDAGYESTNSVPMAEASSLLDDLGVENAQERVEWYNCGELNAEDMERLANVKFNLIECDVCDEGIPQGWPDNWDYFQGVLQGEIGPFVINGQEKEVCADCYQANPVLW